MDNIYLSVPLAAVSFKNVRKAIPELVQQQQKQRSRAIAR